METKSQIATDVAELLLNRQPPAIRTRLQESEILNELGIRTYQGMSIAGSAVLLRHLLRAARKIDPGHPETKIRLLQGDEALLQRTEDGLVLSVQKGEQLIQAPMGFLGLASEDRGERLQILESVGMQLGPTSDVSALRAAAEERPLSEKEMEDLVTEISHGVAGVQNQIREKLASNTFALIDIAPDSLAYYEKFCGPDPGNADPEVYLGTVLPNYRKELLRRGLRRGFEICLLGALRDDICPGPWLDEIDNDALWKVMTERKPELDPISLLAALDLDLYRQADERFRSFAEGAVSRLSSDRYLRSDDIDVYALVPLLARFVLNRLHLMDGGALRSPFWKRMCAWMQATFVARLLAEADIKFNEFSKAIQGSFESAGELASFLDLRKEPMTEAASISPMALRREVIGRLIHFGVREEARGTPMPRFHEAEEAWKRLAKVPPRPHWRLPGPLEGHRRPHLQGRRLPEELKAELRGQTDDNFITNLGKLSQFFGLDEEIKELLRQAISREISKKETSALKGQLEKLLYLGMTAAAERDTALAETAADGVSRLAPELQSAGMIWAAVEALLRAAAAFEEEESWAEWLAKQFLDLASRLPPGRASAILWQHIQELKKVTRLGLGIFRRAEGAASAAASWS